MDHVWIRQIREAWFISPLFTPRDLSPDLQTDPQLGQEAPGGKEV